MSSRSGRTSLLGTEVVLRQDAIAALSPFFLVTTVPGDAMPTHGYPSGEQPRSWSVSQALEKMKEGTSVHTIMGKDVFEEVTIQLSKFHDFIEIILPQPIVVRVNIETLVDVRWGRMPVDPNNPIVAQHGTVIPSADTFTILVANSWMNWSSLCFIASDSDVISAWVCGLQGLLYQERKNRVSLTRLQLQLKRLYVLASFTNVADAIQDTIRAFDIGLPAILNSTLKGSKFCMDCAAKVSEITAVESLEDMDYVYATYSSCIQSDMRDIFSSFTEEEERMTLYEFEQFLLHEQGEKISDPLQILLKYEPLEDNRVRHYLSIEGFLRYLMSSEHGSVLDWETRVKVFQDMDQPLSHYFISSSHNTYVHDHQLRGESSVEMYIQCLLRGCRSLELDCWDGDDGEPEITHAYSLGIKVISFTSRIKFVDVVHAIAQYAFVTSDFPVILSLEDHCSVPQQTKMALYFREILGDLLLDTPLEDHEDDDLPSPNALKRKILIKHKKRAKGAAEVAALARIHKLQQGSSSEMVDDVLDMFDENSPGQELNDAKEEARRQAMRDGDATDQDVFGIPADIEQIHDSLDGSNTEAWQSGLRKYKSGEVGFSDTASSVSDLSDPYHGGYKHEQHELEEGTTGNSSAGDSSDNDDGWKEEEPEEDEEQFWKHLGQKDTTTSTSAVGNEELTPEHDTTLDDEKKKRKQMRDRVNELMSSEEMFGDSRSSITSQGSTEDLMMYLNPQHEGSFNSTSSGGAKMKRQTSGSLEQTAREKMVSNLDASSRDQIRQRSQSFNGVQQYTPQFSSTHGNSDDTAPSPKRDVGLRRQLLGRGSTRSKGSMESVPQSSESPSRSQSIERKRSFRRIFRSSNRSTSKSSTKSPEQDSIERRRSSSFQERLLSSSSSSQLIKGGCVPISRSISSTTAEMGMPVQDGSAVEREEDSDFLNLSASSTATMRPFMQRYQTIEEQEYYKIKEPNMSQELSDLVVYTRAIKFKYFATRKVLISATGQRITPRPVFPFELSSFDDSTALKMVQRRKEQFSEHNVYKLSRIYPHGKRSDSRNYNPLPFWSAGCQLVCPNWQANDAYMMMYDAFFQQLNAGCGYVLKPPHLLNTTLLADRLLAPKKFENFITITVLSGQNLPSTPRYIIAIQLFHTKGVEEHISRELDGKRDGTAQCMVSFRLKLTESDFHMIRISLFPLNEKRRGKFRGKLTQSIEKGYEEMKADGEQVFNTWLTVSLIRKGYRTVQLFPDGLSSAYSIGHQARHGKHRHRSTANLKRSIGSMSGIEGGNNQQQDYQTYSSVRGTSSSPRGRRRSSHTSAFANDIPEDGELGDMEDVNDFLPLSSASTTNPKKSSSSSSSSSTSSSPTKPPIKSSARPASAPTKSTSTNSANPNANTSASTTTTRPASAAQQNSPSKEGKQSSKNRVVYLLQGLLGERTTFEEGEEEFPTPPSSSLPQTMSTSSTTSLSLSNSAQTKFQYSTNEDSNNTYVDEQGGIVQGTVPSSANGLPPLLFLHVDKEEKEDSSRRSSMFNQVVVSQNAPAKRRETTQYHVRNPSLLGFEMKGIVSEKLESSYYSTKFVMVGFPSLPDSYATICVQRNDADSDIVRKYLKVRQKESKGNQRGIICSIVSPETLQLSTAMFSESSSLSVLCLENHDATQLHDFVLGTTSAFTVMVKVEKHSDNHTTPATKQTNTSLPPSPERPIVGERHKSSSPQLRHITRQRANTESVPVSDKPVFRNRSDTTGTFDKAKKWGSTHSVADDESVYTDTGTDSGREGRSQLSSNVSRSSSTESGSSSSKKKSGMKHMLHRIRSVSGSKHSKSASPGSKKNHGIKKTLKKLKNFVTPKRAKKKDTDVEPQLLLVTGDGKLIVTSRKKCDDDINSNPQLLESSYGGSKKLSSSSSSPSSSTSNLNNNGQPDLVCDLRDMKTWKVRRSNKTMLLKFSNGVTLSIFIKSELVRRLLSNSIANEIMKTIAPISSAPKPYHHHLFPSHLDSSLSLSSSSSASQSRRRCSSFSESKMRALGNLQGSHDVSLLDPHLQKLNGDRRGSDDTVVPHMLDEEDMLDRPYVRSNSNSSFNGLRQRDLGLLSNNAPSSTSQRATPLRTSPLKGQSSVLQAARNQMQQRRMNQIGGRARSNTTSGDMGDLAFIRSLVQKKHAASRESPILARDLEGDAAPGVFAKQLESSRTSSPLSESVGSPSSLQPLSKQESVSSTPDSYRETRPTRFSKASLFADSSDDDSDDENKKDEEGGEEEGEDEGEEDRGEEGGSKRKTKKMKKKKKKTRKKKEDAKEGLESNATSTSDSEKGSQATSRSSGKSTITKRELLFLQGLALDANSGESDTDSEREIKVGKLLDLDELVQEKSSTNTSTRINCRGSEQTHGQQHVPEGKRMFLSVVTKSGGIEDNTDEDSSLDTMLMAGRSAIVAEGEDKKMGNRLFGQTASRSVPSSPLRYSSQDNSIMDSKTPSPHSLNNSSSSPHFFSDDPVSPGRTPLHPKVHHLRNSSRSRSPSSSSSSHAMKFIQMMMVRSPEDLCSDATFPDSMKIYIGNLQREPIEHQKEVLKDLEELHEILCKIHASPDPKALCCNSNTKESIACDTCSGRHAAHLHSICKVQARIQKHLSSGRDVTLLRREVTVTEC